MKDQDYFPKRKIWKQNGLVTFKSRSKLSETEIGDFTDKSSSLTSSHARGQYMDSYLLFPFSGNL